MFNIFKGKNEKEDLSYEGLGWHENFILELAKNYKPKTYVELGIYQCSLFNKMKKYAGVLYGVDIDRNAEKYVEKEDKVHFFNGTTEDFGSFLGENPVDIDFVFIDADHSAVAVEADFNMIFPFVKNNGLILLHDSYPESELYTQKTYCGDGYKAIEKLGRVNFEYEMVTIPIPPGLTICRKRLKQVDWD